MEKVGFYFTTLFTYDGFFSLNYEFETTNIRMTASGGSSA